MKAHEAQNAGYESKTIQMMLLLAEERIFKSGTALEQRYGIRKQPRLLRNLHPSTNVLGCVFQLLLERLCSRQCEVEAVGMKRA